MIADWMLFATTAAGFALGMAARRKKRSPPQPKPTCPCDHSIAYHEEGTGICHAEERRDRYSKSGDWTGYEYVPCACRHYSGPELLSAISMRPVTYRDTTTELPN